MFDFLGIHAAPPYHIFLTDLFFSIRRISRTVEHVKKTNGLACSARVPLHPEGERSSAKLSHGGQTASVRSGIDVIASLPDLPNGRRVL